MNIKINSSLVLTITGIVVTVCGIAASFVSYYQNNTISYIIISILLVQIAAILGYLWVDKMRHDERKKHFDLLEILHNSKSKKKWNEIIRLAYPLSRPLWLAKKYKLRVEFGYLIEEACNHLHNQEKIRVGKEDKFIKSILSEILIDDLGWTRYKINSSKREVAKTHIRKGIELARKNKEFPVVIQGLRHLSGIASECAEDKKKVNEHLQEITELMNSNEYKSHVNAKKQHSIKASIEYTYARNKIRYIRFNQIRGKERDEVLSEIDVHIKNAEDGHRANDEDRYAKIFLVKAQALLLKNDIKSLNEADGILKEGYAYCETKQREDNLVRIPMSRLNIRLKKLQLLDELNNLPKNEKNDIISEANKIVHVIKSKILDADDYMEYKQKLDSILNKINRYK